MSISRKISAIAMATCLLVGPKAAMAYQYGGVLESFGGDISNPNSTIGIRGYYLSDPMYFLGQGGQVYTALATNLSGADMVGTVGIQNPMFRYGPRQYSYQYGVKYLISATGYSAKPVAYLGLDYAEELTLGSYLNLQGNLLAPSMFQKGNVGFQVSFGIKYFFDSEGKANEITRIKTLDINKVLQENTILRSGELKEDLSDDIKKFADISESTGIVIPKFVYRGRSFALKRTFEKNTDVVRVWAKVESLNKNFGFKKVSGNTWETSIGIPGGFSDTQVNITIYSKSSKGAVKSEFTTTVVE